MGEILFLTLKSKAATCCSGGVMTSVQTHAGENREDRLQSDSLNTLKL